MTTFADLFSSLKEELAARYRSPFWGTALIALLVYHWKIIVFFLTEKKNALDTIAYIEANASVESILKALIFALLYVIVFPWFELLIARLASWGKHARNDFHTEEREREIGKRKVIAHQQAKLIEMQFMNKENQSMLADIELVKSYHNILAGENFSRWLKDIQNGAINNNLQSAISNYLHKVDSVEGKYLHPEIETAHAEFVTDLSSLGSLLSENRIQSIPNSERTSENEEYLAASEELKKFSSKASESYKAYRQLARQLLGV